MRRREEQKEAFACLATRRKGEDGGPVKSRVRREPGAGEAIVGPLGLMSDCPLNATISVLGKVRVEG